MTYIQCKRPRVAARRFIMLILYRVVTAAKKGAVAGTPQQVDPPRVTHGACARVRAVLPRGEEMPPQDLIQPLLYLLLGHIHHRRTGGLEGRPEFAQDLCLRVGFPRDFVEFGLEVRGELVVHVAGEVAH